MWQVLWNVSGLQRLFPALFLWMQAPGWSMDLRTESCLRTGNAPPLTSMERPSGNFTRRRLLLCKELGLHYFHLRFFSVYGSGDHPWSIISTLVRELPQGKSVSLSACLHQWNFMYIEDAVQAVYELYRHLPSEKDSPKISEIVNVASRDTRVLRSFVEEVWKEAGGRGSLEYGSFVQAKEGALSVRPSVEKLAALTGGFKEAYSFSQGIRQMLP